MIIVQKYHSASDIDIEFIDSLNELVEDYAISFEKLIHEENSHKKNVFFSYYLFFTSNKNTPIAMAIQKSRPYEKDGLLTNLLKPFQKTRVVNWITSKNKPVSLYCHPSYIEDVSKKFNSIVLSNFEQDHIAAISLISNKYTDIHNENTQLSEKVEITLPSYFLRRFKDMEEHLDSVSTETTDLINKKIKEASDNNIDCLYFDTVDEMKKRSILNSAQIKLLNESYQLDYYDNNKSSFLCLFDNKVLKFITIVNTKTNFNVEFINIGLTQTELNKHFPYIFYMIYDFFYSENFHKLVFISKLANLSQANTELLKEFGVYFENYIQHIYTKKQHSTKEIYKAFA